jgi:RHS repeat-associated protein
VKTVVAKRESSVLHRGCALALIGCLLFPPGSASAGAPDDPTTFAGHRGEVTAGAEDASPSLVEAEGFTGAATYRIPIEVPKGTGGFTPEIAVRYSSHNHSDSWVGYGWTLGFSSVARSVDEGIPSYSGTDTYDLDGQKLVQVGTADGGSTIKYHTRRESFVEVLHKTASGVDQWEVHHKNGEIWRYGVVDATRIRRGSNASDPIFQWLLEEQEDAFGNIVKYEYASGGDAGMKYPSRVRYSHHKTQPSPVGGANKERIVEFVRESTRGDKPVNYGAGFERRLTQRLSRIDVCVENCTGSASSRVYLRSYSFTYAESPDSHRSLLDNVKMTGARVGSTIPSFGFTTEFGYRQNAGTPQIGWEETPAALNWPAGLDFVDTPANDRRDMGVRLVDVNGDARLDLVKASAEQNGAGDCGDIELVGDDNGVYLGTNTGWATVSTTYTLPPTWENVDTGESAECGTGQDPQGRRNVDFHFVVQKEGRWGSGMTAVDLTGDGRAEFFGALAKPPKRGQVPGTFPSPARQVLRNRWCSATASGIQCLAQSPTGPAIDGRMNTARMAWYETGNPANFFKIGGFSGNARFADLDGDGRPDLIVRDREDYSDWAVDNNGIGFADGIDLVLNSYVLYNRANRDPSGPVADRFNFLAPSITSTTSPGQGFPRVHFKRAPNDFLICDPTVGDAATRETCEHQSLWANLWSLDDDQNNEYFAIGSQVYGTMPIDVNSDGLSDHAVATDRQNSPKLAHAWLNNGRKQMVLDDLWALPTEVMTELPKQSANTDRKRSRDEGVRLVDVNGDGREDLVKARKRDPGGDEILVWLNDGDVGDSDGGQYGLVDTATTTAGPWRPADVQSSVSWKLPVGLDFVTEKGHDMGVRFADVNADGMVDVLDGARNERHVYLNKGKVPDLLETIRSSRGTETEITYEPSTSFPGAESGTPDLPYVVQVVEAISTTWSTKETLPQVATTHYRYEGGKFDPAAREFRGFRKVFTVEPISRTTVTTFFQDAAKSGLVESSKRYKSYGSTLNERCLSEVAYTYHESQSAPFYALPALVRTSQWNEEPCTATPRQSLTWALYDINGVHAQYGNRTLLYEFGEVIPGTIQARDPDDVRMTDFDYELPPTGRYLVDRVSRVSTTRLAAGSIPRVTSYTYVGNSTRPETKTDGESGTGGTLVTTFHYDFFGNTEWTRDPGTLGSGEGGGGKTDFTYDVTKTFETSRTDQLGNAVTTGYTSIGCSRSHPAAEGLPATIRTQASSSAPRMLCYDTFGRVVDDHEEGSAALTEYSYFDPDPATGPTRPTVTETRRTGATGLLATVTTLDSLGRVLRTETEGEASKTVVTRRGYDVVGRVQTETVPTFSTDPELSTEYIYDWLDRPVEIRHPGSPMRKTLMTYGTGAAPTITTSKPGGIVTKRKVDVFGTIREVSETSDSGALFTTQYTYDATNALLKTRDHLGNETTVEYDGAGRRTRLRDQDAGTTDFFYYAGSGLLHQRKSPAGTETWTYDALGRALTRSASGSSTVWTYDTATLGDGLLATVAEGGETYEVVAYDAMGRILFEKQTAGAQTHEFFSWYDFLGNLVQRQYPNGIVLNFDRDENGVPETIRRGSTTLVSSIDFDARGRIVGWTAGSNGARTTAKFVTAATATNPGTLDELKVVGSGSAVLEQLDYSFEPGDRLSGIDDLRAGAPAVQRRYFYDKLGRLDHASGPFLPGQGSGTLYFAYDAIGNLTCKGATSATGCTGGQSMSYTRAGGAGPHAVTTLKVGAGAPKPIGYTPSGNVASVEGREYEYDGLDRMRTARRLGQVQAEVLYGADGRRLRLRDFTKPKDGSTPARVTYFTAPDFEWDATRGMAKIIVGIEGTTVATIVEPWTTASASIPWIIPDFDTTIPPEDLAMRVLAGLFSLGIALQLAQRRRRGLPTLRPALAGATCVLFVAFASTPPVYALGSDGDLNADGVLDARDLWLLHRYATGVQNSPTPSELQHGDVAPLEHPLANPPVLNHADAALLGRALAGNDVDGDGLNTTGEWAINANPFRADTDGDGLNDGEEARLGTDPTSADTDNDGVSDLAERNTGTDPKDPRALDTDGDGIPDAQELGNEKRSLVYHHGDHLGSSLLLTRSDGAVVERALYEPFGGYLASPTPSAPRTPPDQAFGGQRSVAGLGIYDYGARWYDPMLGRFLQPDSIVPDADDPQSLNRYSYVRNDPTNRIDPSGNFDLGSFFGGMFESWVFSFSLGGMMFGMGDGFTFGSISFAGIPLFSFAETAAPFDTGIRAPAEPDYSGAYQAGQLGSGPDLPPRALTQAERQYLEDLTGEDFGGVQVDEGFIGDRWNAGQVRSDNEINVARGYSSLTWDEQRALLSHEATHILQRREGTLNNWMGARAHLSQGVNLYRIPSNFSGRFSELNFEQQAVVLENAARLDMGLTLRFTYYGYGGSITNTYSVGDIKIWYADFLQGR